MEDLTDPAILVLESLCNYPGVDTPGSIADSIKLQQADAAEIQRGLHELERMGLAQEAHGRWKLTGDGLSRCYGR